MKRDEAAKIPHWAPDELVANRAKLIERIEIQRQRPVVNLSEMDVRASLDFLGDHVGPRFTGDSTTLKILDALISEASMELVWKSLLRRHSSRFKHSYVGFPFLAGGTSQPESLLGACIGAKFEWINTPKRTPAENREFLLSIADKAIELVQLLVQIEHGRELLAVTKYLPTDFFKNFADSLETSEPEGYLEFLLSENLPTIPKLLLKLHDRAKEHAEEPVGIPQPNAAGAEVHHFIRILSRYFLQSYGLPLHANVAAITTAVFKSDIEEDKVRALLRGDRASRDSRARRKIDKNRKDIDG